MNFLTFLKLIILIREYMAMEIDLGDTELQNNILKFGYGINYKYMGTISHSFDRFYVVTKFELPKVQDLQFANIPYDKGCEHLDMDIHVMKNKVVIQHNKIFHLEESMVMYGVYNSDTLEDLIKTVHKLHNTTT